jgi:hypothetical protein
MDTLEERNFEEGKGLPRLRCCERLDRKKKESTTGVELLDNENRYYGGADNKPSWPLPISHDIEAAALTDLLFGLYA